MNNSSGIPGTCGEVAAQLTLSYHNFYSDRRIIENQFLLGSNDPNNEIERNRNPNFSTNPMLMERDTLGSNAAYHAHLNSNFGHLFGGTSLANVKNGITAELNRNNISHTINSNGVLWGLGLFDSVSSDGIKAEIDAGRPVPICIAKNLGADGNHWILAYGYQHINGVFGYIVHYGWTGTDREFAWINANWASGYISLNINHTHNYDYVGGQWGERRCAICQHRQHPFIVDNNGILTSLRYNNITGNIVIPNGIRIPSVNINIDTPIVTIGSNIFQNYGISQISIPASVTNIGSSAFENCTSLTNITLSNNLTTIGSSAFKGCTSLGSITIPSSVTNIGSSAFENCTSLTNVTLPNNLTSIGSSAFKGCANLIDIDFGLNSQLHTVGDYAFQNCSSLTSINIPESLTKAGRTPFIGCDGLYGFIIPGSITADQHRWINFRGSLVTGNHNYVDGVCNICGHLGTGTHVHLYDEHLPASPGNFGYQHHSYCDCGHTKIMPCFGTMPDYPPYDVFCIDCGQYLEDGGILFNIKMSDEEINFNKED